MFGACAWKVLTRLEPGEVLGDLPGRDLFVVPGPLVPLHLDEVVEIVLAPPLAERLAEDVVALELLRRLEEVRRQSLEPAPAELVVGDRVEVLAVRLPRVEALLDAVEAGGEDRRGREIRIRGAVDRPVLDPARAGDAEHLRPVVVAVRDPDRRPRRAARRRPQLQALVRVDG